MASTNQLAEEEETCLAEAELEPTCLDDQARCLAPTSQRVPVLGARNVAHEGSRQAWNWLALQAVRQGPGGWPPQAPAHT